MSKFQKNLALWLVVLFVVLILLIVTKKSPVLSSMEMSFDDFTAAQKKGAVGDVHIQGGVFVGKMKSGTPFYVIPKGSDVINQNDPAK